MWLFLQKSSTESYLFLLLQFNIWTWIEWGLKRNVLDWIRNWRNLCYPLFYIQIAEWHDIADDGQEALQHKRSFKVGQLNNSCTSCPELSPLTLHLIFTIKGIPQQLLQYLIKKSVSCFQENKMCALVLHNLFNEPCDDWSHISWSNNRSPSDRLVLQKIDGLFTVSVYIFTGH